MLELHYYPSNASLAPHLVLLELGLPFTKVLVDRTVQAHKAPDYLALNPNGLIPVLRDGELVLFEAAAICLHLADRPGAPDTAPPLMPPPGTAARAQATKWLVWLTNTLQANLIVYFYPERLVDEGNTEGAAQVKAHAQAMVGRQLDILVAEFERHGGPWLLGGQHSLCDAYAFMLCRWTRGFSGPASAPARERPVLAAWLQRMLARPAVQRLIADEGLLPPLV
ncbi:glutathione S-transferase family protein [Aquabacterium sp. OR-4]|uniref:glutathione S-transferase family protein n=1 Tax=Aquabacterium sp. OR-4 TaxID=2978127 RepID=UPI0028C5493A|nr:glutathione S-transferase family protein [Aquabacterium sp. OR-4]MDT7837873.1 glutathione S-transferase family protein [Aquabacterium sp. OR-4]